MKKSNLGALALIALLSVSSNPALFAGDVVIGPPTTPSADRTRYVALGDSITAAFASNGLAETQQVCSYPALIKAAGAPGAAFEQPLISEPGIPAQLALLDLNPSLVPKNGLGSPLNSTAAAYQNLGVPGFDVNEALTVLTDGGGIADVILRGGGTAVSQAVNQQPTLLTVWLGNNDVLGAATSGLVIDGLTLTTLSAFEASYIQLMDALENTGAGIVVANIPNVTSIPFVSTVPPVVVDPVTREPVIIDGATVPLIGTRGDGSVGPLTLADRVLLPASAALAMGDGLPPGIPGATGTPLPDTLVLDSDEVATILTRTAELNAVISAQVARVGGALVDANAVFDEVASEGIEIGGVNFNADFLTGGLFSYDGVHPTATAHGIVANLFIEAANARYNGSIPTVSLAPFVLDGLCAPDNDLNAGGGGGGDVDAADSLPLFSAAAHDELLLALGLAPVAQLTQMQQAIEDVQGRPSMLERFPRLQQRPDRGGKRRGDR